MLLNDFFKINKIEHTEKYAVSISINPKHTIFDGHFPQNPVVPGVCMAQMLKEIIEHIQHKPLTMVTGDNMKFTAVLNPDINPNSVMTIALKPKDNGLLYADAKLADGEIIFFSFKGNFKDQ